MKLKTAGAWRVGSLALLLAGLSGSASAFDWGVKLEPGIAAPLDSPQSQLFNPGLGASLKGLIGIGRFLDAQVGISFVGLSARAGAPSTELGVAWGYGGGLRLKRPHDADNGVSPWIDGDLMYVRSGPLDRLGYSFGAGLAFAMGEERRWWFGPFVRYLQILQPDRPATNDGDAKIFMVGISLEVGDAHRRAVAPAPVKMECVPCAPIVTEVVVVPKSDRDGDGTADGVDLCPDVAGPAENRGCPYYNKVVIKDDRMELTEKILFAWNKDVIEPESWPLLDEVVRALKENKSFRVLIEGHTDSSGTEAHNQLLSEGRARAVLAYLSQHGVQPERLDARGFSSSQPLQTNKTVVGREANRRVEFMIELKIVNDGSAK